jgi:hypothetical protein
VRDPDYTVLYRYLTGTGAHNFRDSVTLGFLGAYGHTPFDLGALPLAVHNVNHNPHLLPGKDNSQSNQLKKLTKGGVLHKRKTPSLATLNHSYS